MGKRSKQRRANIRAKNSLAQPAAPSSRPFILRSVFALVLGIAIGVVAFLSQRHQPLLPITPNLDEQAEVSNEQAEVPNESIPLAESPDDSIQRLPVAPGLNNELFDSVVGNVVSLEDPLIDGWNSEHFSAIADDQLKKVGEMLSQPTLRDVEHASAIAVEEFSSLGTRPSQLKQVFADQSIRVKRGSHDASRSPLKGHEGFLELIRQQALPIEGMEDIRFKFKIVGVTQGDDRVTNTTAYFQLSGRTKTQSTQINSQWRCRWQLFDPETPKLIGVDVDNYEEIVYANPRGGSMFADCTLSVFRNSDRFAQQLIYGLDHWTDRFDGAIARPAAGHGIAIDDVNGDGLDDVYLCQSPALPNLLLLQNPDGTVRDTAEEAGVNWLEGTRAALLSDLDNDGDPDLVVVLGGKVVVQSNDGRGKFTTMTIVTTPSSLFAVNAVDYDGDRDLDIFICGYTLTSGVNVNDVFANPMPFHDADNGAPNVLLRNDGGWAFTDVTNEVGLDQNSNRFSYASAWDDYDNDGDLDVYVANDFGRNNLYRNDGGRFTDVAPALDVEDIGPGMSAAWGDYNNDGLVDLYVSNMFSSAGNRITSQQQFQQGVDEKTKQQFRRHARGNSLFENLGAGGFQDRSVEIGVTLGRWAWGSLFVDINNDGWEDLYVTNGFVTADGNDDL